MDIKWYSQATIDNHIDRYDSRSKTTNNTFLHFNKNIHIDK